MSACRRCDGSFPCSCNPGLDERQEFIRKTAIQLFSFYTDEDGEPPVTPARAWELAAQLWAAKPEDC